MSRLSPIATLLLAACTVGGQSPDGGPDCVPGPSRCDGTTLVTCALEEGRRVERRRSCMLEDAVCDPSLGCIACRPSQAGCLRGDVAVCRADGSGWDTTEVCDAAAGFGCVDARCEDLCAAAERDRGYLGCEFRALDLDNGVERALSAAAQQYAIVVSNPSPYDAQVVVEVDTGSGTEPVSLTMVAERAVAAGAAEVIDLPHRGLDGSSSPHVNDGTHSAVTRGAYRVRSSVPVSVVQFNPLLPAGTFSEDASLLLPTSAWGDHYTVVAWPQTLGATPSIPDTAPSRSFLTVAAGPDGARVTVTLGPNVGRTAGCDRFPIGRAGDVVELELGEMDVLNLESDVYAADFTGTLVDATHDVAVFVGAEWADVPFVPEYRVAAADHLEEQLLPDRALGQDFVLHPLPSRSRALVEAFDNPDDAPVEPADEPDWVRIVNAGPATAHVTTELPVPFDAAELAPGALWEIRLDGPAHIRSDQPLSIVQLLAGQTLTGIPPAYPGGDPAMLVVPPTSLFRDRHVVLVPPHHAFDFIIVVAPAAAEATLDGESLATRCRTVPIDELWVVHQCQLGFPVVSRMEPRLSRGAQSDGPHTIEASERVGVVVYGWDNYISYAYPGSLSTVNLE